MPDNGGSDSLSQGMADFVGRGTEEAGHYYYEYVVARNILLLPTTYG